MGKNLLIQWNYWFVQRAKIWMKQEDNWLLYPTLFLTFLMNTCGSSHFLGQRELISDAFLGGVLLTGADVRLGRTSNHTCTLDVIFCSLVIKTKQKLCCRCSFLVVMGVLILLFFFAQQRNCTARVVLSRCDKLFDHLKTQPTPWAGWAWTLDGSGFHIEKYSLPEVTMTKQRVFPSGS